MFSALKKKYRLFRYARWRKKYYRRYASLASLGSNTYICDDASLYNLGNISLGNHVWIGHQCYLEGLGGITLGSGTIVGNKVEIISANHNFKGEDITEVPYDKRFIKRPVTIGENVWIGMRALILPGGTVGEGAVIGAGSVVTGEVPPLAIVGGNPAKVLKYRDAGQYYRLKGEGKIYLKENYNYEVSDERLK